MSIILSPPGSGKTTWIKSEMNTKSSFFEGGGSPINKV